MKLTIGSMDNGVVRAQLSGTVTQADVSPFLEPLGDALGSDGYARSVVLGMSEVEMLDSSGVSWLLMCQKRFRQGGGRLVLHSLSDIASNILRVLNLHAVLKVADSEQDAVQLVQEAS